MFLVLLSLGFLPVTPALADSVTPVTYSKDTAELIIRAFAVREGIDGDDLYNTLKCESNLDPKAIGDHGTSLGIAQIHLPAHRDITKEQALDPLWSLDWTAKQFKAGNQKLWSCWRLIPHKARDS